MEPDGSCEREWEQMERYDARRLTVSNFRRSDIRQRVEIDSSGCWNWKGWFDSNGYARFGRKPVHRISYEVFGGPIPDGLQLDHLCRNRKCVNPAHLEPVTNRTNVLRGISFAAVNALKTSCVSGHPLTGENLRIYRGKRICIKCTLIRAANFKIKQRTFHVA